MTTNVHNYIFKKKIGLKFIVWTIKIYSPDYIKSGFFEFFESLPKMDHS